MRILDRYILKSMWSAFIACLLIFVFLYCIIDLFSHLDEVLKQKTPIDILIKYYMAFLPIIFVQISPIACLLATVYSLGNLNRDNEIVAMRSAGLSIWSISHVLIIFGFIVSILVFTVNEKFVYQAQDRMRVLKQQIESEKCKTPKKEAKKQDEVIKNLSIYGLGNRLFFINKFSVKENTIEGITILEQNKKHDLTAKIIANKGIWDGNLWKFYQVQTFQLNEKGRIIGEPRYSEEEIMDIPESPKDFLNQQKLPEFMNIAQLETYIWKLSQGGAKSIVQSLRVDLYSRYAFAFTSLIIIFLGVPFSMKIRKKAAGLSSIGVSIILSFIYYVTNAVAIALGKGAILPPLLSAWLANIIFFFISLYLISQLP
ncbi:MAG: LptF/LptG family permease [Candidatus Omnitrophica bacterium]|nr:LptF/LptG family permease [Candidatus Omnitrophota bacterium]